MKVVVTRHAAFVTVCHERGLIEEDGFVVLAHASPEEIKGKTVITSGLPLHLAALCKSVVTIPLTLPPELRGKELSVEQMREHAGETEKFLVMKVDS